MWKSFAIIAAGVYCYCFDVHSVSAVPRHVTFVVVDDDEESGQSNPAIVMINFQSIDNPPVLDLNGPQQPGRDNWVTFVEGGNFTLV